MTTLGTARILRGSALDLPLDDASVDLVVTSPPYFGLRSYTDGGAPLDGQLGAEPTPTEYVDALVAATREMVRVLKPSGSIWVNLGDKYAGGGGYAGAAWGFKPKTLVGLPWRYAIRCVDDLGLILRAEVVWSKPNGLPESVTDRVRRSHETWFHFTKSPRYFAAVDEVREATNAANDAHSARYREAAKTYGRAATDAHPRSDGSGNGLFTPNPLGKLPGSVWSIPTQPLRIPAELGVDHFAAFPMEWPRRIIAGWSPSCICTACGEGRRPVVRRDPFDPDLLARRARRETRADDDVRSVSAASGLRVNVTAGETPPTRITGYACACVGPTVEVTGEERDPATGERVTYTRRVPDPAWVNPAPTTPAVVLDPFGGTGTTALVAKVLGRDGISVDLSADYCRVAEWRTNDPAQILRAQRGPTPKKAPR